MTDLTEAARAPRKYWPAWYPMRSKTAWVVESEDGQLDLEFADEQSAEDCADRLNLIAVLEAVKAIDRPVSREFIREIDALIAEAKA